MDATQELSVDGAFAELAFERSWRPFVLHDQNAVEPPVQFVVQDLNPLVREGRLFACNPHIPSNRRVRVQVGGRGAADGIPFRRLPQGAWVLRVQSGRLAVTSYEAAGAWTRPLDLALDPGVYRCLLTDVDTDPDSVADHILRIRGAKDHAFWLRSDRWGAFYMGVLFVFGILALMTPYQPTVIRMAVHLAACLAVLGPAAVNLRRWHRSKRYQDLARFARELADRTPKFVLELHRIHGESPQQGHETVVHRPDWEPFPLTD